MAKPLKQRMLGLAPEEASFSRRGFPGRNSGSREHLERVLRTFITGYNMALTSPGGAALAAQLDSAFSPEFAGFAYEGAGLWFGLADLLLPRTPGRLREFLQTAGARHDFIAAVGAGFAIARAPLGLRRLKLYQSTLDPMSAWCLTDGYGFHQGFFHWRKFIEDRTPAPAWFDPQRRALFDSGVGRAMWWVFGAEPSQISAAIGRFEPGPRPEMWAGIGTALAYAGGIDSAAMLRLLDLARNYRADLLSGIPFAAHMRQKAGNPASWTDEACAQCLNLSVAEASGLIVSELNSYLGSWTGPEPEKWDGCYLALRSRVKLRLAGQVSEAALPMTAAGTGWEGIDVQSN